MGGEMHFLFFAPSAGEYEMIKLFLFKVHEKYPKAIIELIFFSPSGYSYFQSSAPDFIRPGLSPFDTPAHVNQFFKSHRIDEVFIATLAVWPVFLEYLIKHEIPYHFIGAHTKSSLFKKIGYLSFQYFIAQARTIFCIDQQSYAFLSGLTQKCILAGDPRVDSIQQDSLDRARVPEEIRSFRQNGPLIIFGSTHRSDEEIILPTLDRLTEDHWKIVIAPHDMNRSNELKNQLPKAIFLSNFKNFNDESLVILDRTGILKYCYQLAEVVFIGGGFGPGVHNTLESILQGRRTCCGPKCGNFYLSQELVQHKLLSIVKDPEELLQYVWDVKSQSSDSSDQDDIDKMMKKYTGATNRILESLFDDP